MDTTTNPVATTTITIPADARGLAAFCAALPDALPAWADTRARDNARAIARHARHLAGVIEATRRPCPYGGYYTPSEALLAFSRAKEMLRKCAAEGTMLLSAVAA